MNYMHKYRNPTLSGIPQDWAGRYSKPNDELTFKCFTALFCVNKDTLRT